MCKRKIQEAIKWFKRAAAVADAENPESLYQLHLIYEKGKKEDNVLIDIGYSRSVLMEAAQLKYPLALFKVGQCLQRGDAGFTRDIREAFNFFNEAASRGNAEAMFELSGFYLTGNAELTIKADTAEAFRRAKASADLGYAKAMYGVGVYCEQGIGLAEADREGSLDWFFRAASAGDKKAIEKLKRAGRSVPKSKDKKKSLSFFKMMQ